MADLLPFPIIVMIDDDQPHSAAWNMAMDEALLGGLSDTPLLRCYRWAEHAVSFGYFGLIAAMRNEYPGRELVRRWTGGGIVEHDDDFTYTLLVPRALPMATLRAGESYRLIHGAVAAALASVGAPPVEYTRLSADTSPRFDSTLAARNEPFLRACFLNPVPHDLLADGRKVAGGAQRRTRHGLLHQGSIQGFRVTEEAGRQTLARSLAASLAARVRVRPPTPEELSVARALVLEKYGSRAWMEKR